MKFEKTILVRKDKFDPSNFKKIASKAKKEIAGAKPHDLLALSITINSPLTVVEAKIYNKDVFDGMLKG